MECRRRNRTRVPIGGIKGESMDMLPRDGSPAVIRYRQSSLGNISEAAEQSMLNFTYFSILGEHSERILLLF